MTLARINPTKYFALALPCLIFACESTSASQPPTPPVAAAAAQTKFGFTPFPYDATVEAVRRTQEIVEENSNIYALHFDSCVPWHELLKGEKFPKYFSEDWDDLALKFPAGHTRYVALAPLNKDRDKLAPACGSEPDVPTDMPRELRSAPFDSDDLKRAYLAYARRAVVKFRPDYLNIGIEIDRLPDKHPRKWAEFQKLFDYVKTEIQRELPDVQIGVSFGLQGLLDDRVADRARPLVERSDYLGLSFYPYAGPMGEKFGARSLGKGKDRWLEPLAWLREYTDKPIAICETGFTTQDINLPAFDLRMTGSVREQEEYVKDLVEIARRDNYLFVIWFLAVDYDQLYGKMPAGPEREVSLLWRNIGLYDGNVKPKPALNAWKLGLDRSGRAGSETRGDRSTGSTELNRGEGSMVGFRNDADLFIAAPGGRVSLDRNARAPNGLPSMLWQYRYKNDWQYSVKEFQRGVASGSEAVSFWIRSDREGPIIVNLEEEDGEAFYGIVEVGEDWKDVYLPYWSLSPDQEKRKNGRLEPNRVSKLLIVDPAGLESAKGDRRLWISELRFAGSPSNVSAESQTAEASSPGRDELTGRPRPGRERRIGFEGDQDLFVCAPGGKVSLDDGPNRGGVAAMKWEYRYSGDWQYCAKELQPGRFAGARTLDFRIRSDVEGPMFVTVEESSGESFYAIINVSDVWTAVSLELDRMALDQEKRVNGRLESDQISKILIVDSTGRDGAKGKRTVLMSQLAFDGAAEEGGFDVARTPDEDENRAALDARPAGTALGFSDESQLFVCAPGGRTSLDKGETPRSGSASMRWKFSYRGDWQYCAKEFAGRPAEGAETLSFWLRSDKEGPVFITLEESDGESFYAILAVDTEWRQTSLELSSFSLDGETRKDGRLDAGRLSKMLIVDPAGREGARGDRVLWLAELRFR